MHFIPNECSTMTSKHISYILKTWNILPWKKIKFNTANHVSITVAGRCRWEFEKFLQLQKGSTMFSYERKVVQWCECWKFCSKRTALKPFHVWEIRYWVMSCFSRTFKRKMLKWIQKSIRPIENQYQYFSISSQFLRLILRMTITAL